MIEPKDTDVVSHAQPTPGPWHVVGDRRDVIAGPQGEELACLYASDGADDPIFFPVAANARLMAAAPELLAAAKAAFHALKSYEYGNASPDLARDVARAIEEAIATAESEGMR